jgi:transforming growth factor-beta-induced protein
MRAFALVAAAALASAQFPGTISEFLRRDQFLRTLDFAVEAGGLTGALNGTGPFTLFAPDDNAFDAVGRNILDYLLNHDHQKILDSVLTYHVHAGAVHAKDLTNGEKVSTLDGAQVLTVAINGAVVKINAAQVIRADLDCSNGVVHVLNGVLVPSNFALPPKDILTIAVATPELTTLVAAVTAANITAALAMPNGPYTVFAPTNSAFAKIPKATLDYLLAHPDELRPILFYHLTDRRIYADEIRNYQRERTLDGREIVFIVNSTGVFINDEAKVIAVNIDATNGVVHEIDTVLIPAAIAEGLEERVAAWSSEVDAPAVPNIVEIAVADPDLSTLVAALTKANLVSTLEGAGPFTVFAPTNEAFAQLPPGILKRLLANVTELTNVLLYHVLAGNVQANQIKNHESVPTAFAGHNMTFDIVGPNHNVIIIDFEARVTRADIEASNGVVHLIDRVLLPRA